MQHLAAVERDQANFAFKISSVHNKSIYSDILESKFAICSGRWKAFVALPVTSHIKGFAQAVWAAFQ